MPALAPFIFVSTGTLVPVTPVLADIPMSIKWPLHIPHRLGIVPSPDRFLADSAYQPLKDLGNCWVEPLVRMGLADRARSVEAAKKKLRLLIQQNPGRAIILVGQSQGGLVASEIVLDPEFAPKIAACIMAGSSFLGSPVVQGALLAWAKVFPGVAQLEPGHPSLTSLCERVVASWPRHVRPILVADPDDGLVPWPSAFGLQFPEGVIPRLYCIGDRLPEGAQPEIVHRQGRARPGWHHVGMCRQPSLIEVVEEIRRELTPAVVQKPTRLRVVPRAA